MTTSLPVIDLFAGAGGLGLGAVAAGGSLVLSIDNDTFSHKTLELNPSLHPGLALQGDVTKLKGADLRRESGLSTSDEVIVVGGAPCQPFSKAAYWLDEGKDAAYRRARSRGEAAERPTTALEARQDDRRDLVAEFWRLVEQSKATGFVFENVPSILHPRNRPIFEALWNRAEDAGYQLTKVVAKATDFGVAQARQRVFLLGSRISKPVTPQPTHSDDPRDGLLPLTTAGEAIGRFSAPEFFEPEEVVVGTWADHLRDIPPGMNYKHHTAWANHPAPTFEAETRYWNFLLKLSPDRPSWTIPASPGPWTGPFHWDSRRLRTSEMAALQGFPDGYRFAGSRRERVRQIGNAVPAPMASAMVASVLTAQSSRRLAA